MADRVRVVSSVSDVEANIGESVGYYMYTFAVPRPRTRLGAMLDPALRVKSRLLLSRTPGAFVVRPDKRTETRGEVKKKLSRIPGKQKHILDHHIRRSHLYVCVPEKASHSPGEISQKFGKETVPQVQFRLHPRYTS